MSDKSFHMMSTKNLCLLSIILIRVKGYQVNMDWSDSAHHMLPPCPINIVPKLNYESALFQHVLAFREISLDRIYLFGLRYIRQNQLLECGKNIIITCLNSV